MTIPDRLKAARNALGLIQRDMAVQSGVSVRGYQGYEDGRSVPGGEAIEGFVRKGINANWLLTGEGPMFLKELRELEKAAEEAEALRARVEQLTADLVTARSQAQGINAAAMRAIIVGTIEGQKAYDSPPDHIARLAVDFYEKAVAEGMITTTGIGDGGEQAA